MVKMLFCNIAWMKRYQGVTENDKPMHGGAFVDERGYGAEVYNFQPFGDKMYGFVEAGWRPQPKRMNIARLGAPRSAPKISGILIIWVAREPLGGRTVVLGWYKDAEVYRDRQNAPVGSNREQPDGEDAPYCVTANKGDCLLIPWKERGNELGLEVERAAERVAQGKSTGGIGRSNIWYAEDDYGREIKPRVLEYIAQWEKRRQLAARLE
jgi:hypothetical protein